MMEFVTQASKQLGISQTTSRSVTGGLLDMIREKTDAGTFAELVGKLPGASEMVERGAPPGPGSGGGLGDLMGKVASAVGTRAEGAVGLAGIFGQAGLGMDKAGPFVGMFLNFIREKAGPGLVEKVLGGLPELAKLAR